MNYDLFDLLISNMTSKFKYHCNSQYIAESKTKRVDEALLIYTYIVCI